MIFMEKLDQFIRRNFTILIAIALILAACMRFVKLGSTSLTDHEASLALQAFNPDRIIGGQPGYVGLTSLLFNIFEGSDFFARFWPAIFGIVLVLVPGLFRKQIGELAIVFLAFLIALEPGLVALSRSADGSMITITALLLTIGLVMNRKMIPSGVFAGLALAGSENYWLLALSLGLAWLVVYVITTDKPSTFDIEHFRIEKTNWLRFAFATLITLLLVSSQFLLRPNGISGIGSTITDFAAQWQPKEALGLGAYLLTFLITQFPALILGLWGLSNGLREKSKWSRLLGLWWMIGLLLAVIIPSHDVMLISMVNLPLFVLAAIQIARLFKGIMIHSNIVLIAESVVTISLLVFATINFLNMINFPPVDEVGMRNRLIGTFLPLALWLAFTVLMAWGWDSTSTKSGIIIGLGILLGASLIGSGWKAAGLGSYPENELLAYPGYVIGQKDLLQTVQDVSSWNIGQKNRIDVELVGIDSPSVNWAFRNFETISEVSGFPVSDTPSIVISKMDAVIQTQSLYRGQAVVWSVQPDYSQANWQNWVKWFFTRQIPQRKSNLLLWVRNDLFKDSSE